MTKMNFHKKLIGRLPLAKSLLPGLRAGYNRYIGPLIIRSQVSGKPQNLKVVIGSSGKIPKGWIGTDIENLNILKQGDWEAFFPEGAISNLLAEHVWEHLSYEDGLVAASLCAKFLRTGGRLRIAVPDGNHPSGDYLMKVRPPADGHQMLYTVESLTKLLMGAGLQANPLEYWDGQGNFHANPWQDADGHVMRSSQNDPRNQGRPLAYTSLIVDGIK